MDQPTATVLAAGIAAVGALGVALINAFLGTAKTTENKKEELFLQHS